MTCAPYCNPCCHRNFAKHHLLSRLRLNLRRAFERVSVDAIERCDVKWSAAFGPQCFAAAVTVAACRIRVGHRVGIEEPVERVSLWNKKQVMWPRDQRVL
jgi:hypothetical protein